MWRASSFWSSVRKSTFPLTAEQRALHDSARDEAMELADKWTHFGFLSEKTVGASAAAIRRMLMACDTYLADGHSNSGTKVAEAVERVRAAVADAGTRRLLFSAFGSAWRDLWPGPDGSGHRHFASFREVCRGSVGGNCAGRFASDSATEVFLRHLLGVPRSRPSGGVACAQPRHALDAQRAFFEPLYQLHSHRQYRSSRSVVRGAGFTPTRLLSTTRDLRGLRTLCARYSPAIRAGLFRMCSLGGRNILRPLPSRPFIHNKLGGFVPR